MQVSPVIGRTSVTATSRFVSETRVETTLPVSLTTQTLTITSANARKDSMAPLARVKLRIFVQETLAMVACACGQRTAENVFVSMGELVKTV